MVFSLFVYGINVYNNYNKYKKTKAFYNKALFNFIDLKQIIQENQNAEEIVEKLLIARGNEDIELLSNKVNQHGLIVGATGSGKTVTLESTPTFRTSLAIKSPGV